jgi:uncharacterized protein (TIRG00374 family)
VARVGPTALTEDAAAPTAPATRRERALRLVPGLVISATCIAIIAMRVDLEQAATAVGDFQWLYLLPGLLLLGAGYCARILRWSMLLRAAGAQAGFRACASPLLGSIALNNVLPLRLGDVVRALVFPAAIGVSRTTATSSLVIERLIDLLTLVLLLLAGLSLDETITVPAWLVRGSLALTFLCLVALAVVWMCASPIAAWARRTAGLSQPGRWASAMRRVAQVVAELLESTHAMSKISLLPRLIAVSACVWMGEAGFYWAVLAGFGLPSAPTVAMLVMASVTLSTLIPSSPGYVGTFHLAAYAIVSTLGAAPAQAASFAFLSHLSLWVATTAAGGAAIAYNPQLFAGLRTHGVGRKRPAAP